LIHVILVMFLGTRALFQKYVEPPDFESDEGGFLADQGQAAATPPPVKITQPIAAPPAPKVKAITVDTAAPTAFVMPVTPIVPHFASATVSDKAVALPVMASGGHNVRLPATMVRRATNKDRERSVGEKGGDKVKNEQAVANSLRWLQKVQKPDGTWGSGYPGAMTGLATLCFLGHGETPQSNTEFSAVAAKAINAYVVEGTKSAGRMIFRGTDLTGQATPYEHGIGTYALCEAYTMTKDERLAPIVKQAVKYIIDGQGADGGWMYGYSKETPSDTSVSGWQMQALKAAYLTDIPGVSDKASDALDRSMKNLDRVFDKRNGAFGYRNPGDKNYALTGVGVLCKLYWQGRTDTMVRAGLKNIMEGPPIQYGAKTSNLYAWYYHTQACFMAGQDYWTKWNRLFQKEIMDNQDAEGFWPVTGGTDVGGLSQDKGVNGQIYRTALCTLMLEVYYRYLPTEKEHGSKAAKALGGM